ncbi:MAG: YaiI/YqxD family protein [Bacillota bacterium]
MTANIRRIPKIIVDADSCPVKETVVKVGAEFSLPVVIIASVAHELPEAPGVENIRVDSSPQAVDMAVINHLYAGDIAVTGDFGLASLILGKGGRVLSPRGFVYSDKNIDRLLLQRHMDAKIRRAGGRTKGPRAFTGEDRSRFEENLRKLCQVSHPTAGKSGIMTKS